jgi:hypothetical protein
MPSKTTAATPEEYIDGLEGPRRGQVRAIYEMVREAAPELEPFMIAGKIGFGRFNYKGKTCEGEWFKLGLASNKNTIAFYSCAPGLAGETLAESFAPRLPKAKIGKSCINFKKLEDVDMAALREIALRLGCVPSFIT